MASSEQINSFFKVAGFHVHFQDLLRIHMLFKHLFWLNIFIYIYIHIGTTMYIYIYIYAYMCTHVNIHTHTFECIRTCKTQRLQCTVKFGGTKPVP